MIYTISNFIKSGSKSMNVNGSVTPQTFTYSPGVPAQILGITCILKDEGTCSLTNFGAIAGLTNGLLIQVVIGGVTTTMSTLKDNADLTTRFGFNQFGSSAVLSVLSIVTPVGFGNSNNVFVGYLEFPQSAPVVLDSADSIQVVIQDNLTNIDLLQMAVKAVMD